MKYFSMFTGIGGFELGIQKAIPGAESVGFSEIDKYAISVFNKQIGGKNYGDATRIDTAELSDFELLVGGFPCQAFSVAGKRRGFEEARGTLFFDVARILADKRPRHFILENVKGLLTHDEGKTFQTILEILADMGYLVEWQVCNSKDFGVPQSRERVYIVGHSGGACGGEVFPIFGTNAKIAQELTINTSDALRIYDTNGVGRTLKALDGGLGAKTGLYAVHKLHGEVVQQPEEIAHTVDANYFKGLDNHGQRTAVMSIDRKSVNSSTRRGVVKEERIGTLDTDQQQIVAIPVQTPDRINKKQNGRRFKENGDPAYTVTSSDRQGIFDGMRIRRLTPRECERLQGFPDDWTRYSEDGSEISDSQRYKMAGNAVTVNTVEAVASSLFKVCYKKEGGSHV